MEKLLNLALFLIIKDLGFFFFFFSNLSPYLVKYLKKYKIPYLD